MRDGERYTVAFYTLGCKVNQYETQALREAFAARPFAEVGFDEPADAYVINTCTVTAVADRKGRQAIGAARRRNEQAVIAVCGCYAEGSRAEVEALPGVGVVVGNEGKETLAEAVLSEVRQRVEAGTLVPVARRGQAVSASPFPRTRALLKIQDGCNQVCSYCLVPRVRGPQRSRPLPEVVAEAERLVGEGGREVVLTGVRLGAYGHDWPDRRRPRWEPLVDLLCALTEIPGLRRLRLSSILPLDLSPAFFQALADLSPVCPHLHLPLQSGDEEVLRRMRRGYRPGRFAELVRQAREARPNLALTTDVLVGFPGETEAQFQNTLRFAEEMRFAKIHVFPYSPRPGTAAAEMEGQVPPAEKDRRAAAMRDLAARLSEEFHRQQVGREVEVLVETVQGGVATGFTDNYVRVRLAGDFTPGSFVRARLTSADTEGVWGSGPTGWGEENILSLGDGTSRRSVPDYKPALRPLQEVARAGP